MLDEFKRYLRKDGKSMKTIYLYTCVIEEFERWYNESHKCEFHYLKKADVQEFVHYLESNKKCNQATIKVRISIITKFNEFLIHCNVQDKIVM